jgi:hypothetical protein
MRNEKDRSKGAVPHFAKNRYVPARLNRLPHVGFSRAIRDWRSGWFAGKNSVARQLAASQ